MLAPITLFTYARPDHTQRTVEALLRNPGVNEHHLIVYSDAPRTPDKAQSVAAVREYLQTVTGFRSVTIHPRPQNYGLAKSIIEGVTEVLLRYERIIVLEDDMVTSPHFLSYMNEALEKYADEDHVVSIHGYVYPVMQQLPEAFFLPGADCWGWATWQRGWKIFNSDGQALFDELKRRKSMHAFDYNGTYPLSKMLVDQINGKNDSWAVRWFASAFLEGKLTLYPGRSLIHNIGNDGSGTHCGSSNYFDTELSGSPINLDGVKVEASEQAMAVFENFFIMQRSIGLKKILHKLYSLFKRYLV